MLSQSMKEYMLLHSLNQSESLGRACWQGRQALFEDVLLDTEEHNHVHEEYDKPLGAEYYLVCFGTEEVCFGLMDAKNT